MNNPVLNGQSRADAEGWYSSLGVGRGANNSSASKLTLLRKISQGPGIGQIIWYDANSIQKHEIWQL